MIRAIIFDFDGLIIDTEGALHAGWQETYQAYGLELPLDLWQQTIGTVGVFDPYLHLAEASGQALDRAALRAAWEPRWRARLEALDLLPGVTQALGDAEQLGLARAVASSSDLEWVGGWLNRHGLRERFGCVITREQVARVKPAPDLFLKAAECLGVAPHECLVLEDSPPGMTAARAAGMRCVGVPGPLTRSLPLPEVDIVLDSLADLPLTSILAYLEK